jgi:glyoxylase-like metal-dependent hydrolase (beta-lactamase superfamily II)
VRAVSLHPDVLLVTSAVMQLNCVIVRSGEPHGEPSLAEAFVIDSPALPEELDALPSVLERAGFPAPSGLLCTHGDWDHLLGRLAFADLALGCAESTFERLSREPGDAQRALRAFDEELYIERARPLGLGSLQALPVPGRCELAADELELLATAGHTPDGMAIRIPWASVLVAGDYLSSIEIPTIDHGGRVEDYLQTLARLRDALDGVEQVVPGHGPVTGAGSTMHIIEQDERYLRDLLERGADAELPQGRRTPEQRRLHSRNVAALSSPQ